MGSAQAPPHRMPERFFIIDDQELCHPGGT
jgi:hypothetical protein